VLFNDFKSPGADKPKENFAVTTPSVPQDAKEYTSEDVPLLVQLLADKQKLIESMQAALADNEQQMLRLRSLRRGTLPSIVSSRAVCGGGQSYL